MKPPGERARLVLARYKAATSPDGADKARLLEIIQQRALRGDLPRFVVQTAAPVVPKPSFAQWVWGSPLGKAGLALAVVGLPALGLYETHEIRTRSSLPAAASARPREPVEAPTLPVTSEEEQQMPGDPGPSTSPRARADKPNDAPLPSEPTIDEEVKLMNGAQLALRSGNPSHALQLLNEDARRFPNGKLASARAVAHMVALCRLGRADEARLEADRFLAKNPSSPFADRVKAVCSSPSESR
jgi:hypothetical protein